MIKFFIALSYGVIVSGNPRLLQGGKIVGGESIDITETPYQISLHVYGSFICGGSIISTNYVLTAGHCSLRDRKYYMIRAGSTHKWEEGSKHTISKVIIHENYGRNKDDILVNDIALMKVNPPFKLDKTRQPIPLMRKGAVLDPGTCTIVSGWGRTEENGYLPNELQVVTVPIISREECEKSYQMHGTLPYGQICAGYPKGGKDSCQGDSGGPLVSKGYLTGIVSWGQGCARPSYPGVYTEIAYYHDWIKYHAGL